MGEIIMTMVTAATYAVFLRSLIFSGGLGATEVIRAAQRNSEILLSSLLVGLFSAATGAVCRLLTTYHFVWNAKSGALHNFSLADLPYAWLAAIYGGVLLVLYLLACGVIALLPIKSRPLLLKRIGVSGLNTLVMAVPLLVFRLGNNLPGAIGMGLGAGLAFLIVSLLVNSGLHILQQNKAIPPMFQGVPAALIYTGLLALAFTGFTGEVLFQ
jgi:Na+-translocating ferredoxin:NAD+ oxidoreductase RnfA subunit